MQKILQNPEKMAEKKVIRAKVRKSTAYVATFVDN